MRKIYKGDFASLLKAPLKTFGLGGVWLSMMICLLISSSMYAQTFTDVSSSYNFKPVKIGAGGFVTGMISHPNGTMYCRTDVGGAYRLDAGGSVWKQLLTAQGMPAAVVYPGAYGGVASIAPAPSDVNTVYMAFNATWKYGTVYKSTNKGDNWTKTNLPLVLMQPNGDGRLQGERLAVDPSNANVVYYGTNKNGVYNTYDGGNQWTQISLSTIPAGLDSAYGVGTITFDPSSGTTNGRTNKIYVTTYLQGIYYTSNAGGSWSKLTGGPGDYKFTDADMGSDGAYYVTSDSYGNSGQNQVWKYKSGTWTNITPNSNYYYAAVAVDPNNTNRVFASDDHGTVFRSTTAGGSWTQQSVGRTSPQIPWLAWTDETWFSTGEIIFDRSTSGKLWIAQGIGVWSSTDINDTDITWTSVSQGIEEMVNTDIVKAPGQKLVTSFWDRALFYSTNDDTYPSKHGISNKFNSAWDIDYCATDPSFMVAVVSDHRGCSPDPEEFTGVYSTNGGQSWINFANIPSQAKFGVIAVSATNKDNIVWLPSSDKMPYYTTTRGASWTQVTLPGTTEGGHDGFWANKKVLTADAVTANTFYMYHWKKGIYKSTNGGASWTLQSQNPPLYEYHAILKAVPGQAGHLYLASGIDGTQPLFRTKNGGLSWEQVPGTQVSNGLGFGKAAPGNSYPAIYIQGKINGQIGIFRSIDEGATWAKIVDYPLGVYDYVKTIEGDKDTFGKVYIGYSSTGVVTGSLNADTAAPSIPSNLNVYNTYSVKTDLSWTESTDNTGIAYYQVFNGTVSLGTSPKSPMTITGLTPNTSYTVTVKAFDLAGNASAASSSKSFTTSAPDTQAPTAPTGLNASSVFKNEITLNWAASQDNVEVTVYDIYQNNVKIGTTSSPFYRVTGLSQGASYTMKVRALDAAGNGTYSPNLSVTTSSTDAYPPLPAIPQEIQNTYGINLQNFMQKVTTGQPVKVVFFGQSLNYTNMAWTGYIMDYFRATYPNTTFTSENKAVPGCSSDCLLPQVQGQLTGTNPDLIIFQDYSTGYDSYLAVINKIKQVTPNAEMLIFGDHIHNTTEAGQIYHDSWSFVSLPEIAATNGYAFVHIRQAWKDYLRTNYGGELNWWPLLADEVHFNAHGSWFLTELMKPYFKRFYDATAPTVPTGLAADNKTATSFNLKWTASTDNNAVTSYEILQNNVKIGTTSNTNYLVTGLTASTTYSMKVKALDAAKNSATSQAFNVTTLSASAITDYIVADYDVYIPVINTASATNTQQYNPSGTSSINANNPSLGSANNSAKVGQFNKPASTWQLVGLKLPNVLNAANYTRLELQVYGAGITQMYVQVSDGTNMVAETFYNDLINNQWATISVNLPASGNIRDINIFPNPTEAAAITIYIDNIKLISSQNPGIPVTGVTVTPTTATLNIGATQQLSATVAPANASNKAVTWNTSNSSIATVSASGLVTAVAGGTATITVTTQDGSKTATSTITVNPPATVAVTSVSLSPTTATLNVGATQQLSATVAPSNATNKNVTWSSSNTSRATVSSSGLVTAVSAGTATITVTTVDGTKTATSSITVNAVTPPAASDGKVIREYWTGVSGTAISAIPVSSNPSGTSEITTLECPTNWADNYGQRLRGYIVPTTTGSYTFYVASDDNSELWLSTDDQPATKVKIASVSGYTSSKQWTKYSSQQSTAKTLTIGQKYYFEVLHKEGGGGDNLAIGWTGPGISTISVIGSANISSYAGGTSTVAVTSVSVSPTTATLNIGATQQLSATVAPSNATNKNVTWSSSNTSRATVSSSGLVKAVSAGSATITVITIDGAKTATSSITVNAVTPPATSDGKVIREYWTGISGGNVSDIPLGNTPSGTSEITTLECPTNWADNYGQRLRGYIVPTISGSYTFYVASDDNSELWLSTTDQPSAKIKIAQVDSWTNNKEWTKYSSQQSAVITLTVGQKYYFEVLHKEGGGGDNLAVGWTGPGISTISVIGSANISSYAGGTSTVAVTGVSMSPTTVTLNVGATQQLSATVAPSNATNKTVTWSSSNTSRATVSSSGLVTAVSAGTATITVTTVDGSKTATSSITVNTTPPPTGGNLALNKPVTFSSAESSNTAAQGNDGNSGTRWAGNYGGTNWWQVDLQANYNLSKVEIDWESNFATYPYKVEVSTNGTSGWVTVVDHSSNSTYGATVDNISTSSIRYVRVTYVGSGWASFWECRIFGTSGSRLSIGESIDDQNLALSVYPNPANGLVNLDIPKGEKARIELFNLSGASMLSVLKDDDKKYYDLDIHHIKAGIYLIKVNTESRTYNQRLVIQ